MAFFNPSVDKSSLLLDESYSINYSQLVDSWGQLDSIFTERVTKDLKCLFIRVRNTIDSLKVVSYLMDRRINFYITSSLSANNQVPDFCDYILQIGGRHDVPIVSDESVFTLTPSATSNENAPIAPNSGSIFLSTSGSTGAPKYIYFRSDRLLGNAKEVCNHFGMGPKMKMLIPVPIGHMFGLGVGVLPSLLSGAQICLIEKNNILKLYQRIQTFKPHITLITPNVISMLLEYKKNISNGFYISAGDQLGNDIASEFEVHFGRLINLYGSSEMGAIGTSYLGEERSRPHSEIIPLNNVELKIAGSGDKGEILCLRNNRFDHYVDNDGEIIPKTIDGWFETKDLGCKTGKDTFKILGRTNNTIIRSGFLISLKEVEERLQMLFTSFNEIVVVKRKVNSTKGSELIAIFETTQKINSETREHIIQSCHDKILNYMRPDKIFFINQMPRLVSGKIDRSTLNNQVINYERSKKKDQLGIIGKH